MSITEEKGPDTIVLIHGLWMTPLSWEHWITRYTERGYTVIAPAWPGADADVDALRADPSGLAGVGIEQILEHYEEILKALPSPPIIMGHSFGGAFTEILLDRGYGAAGVGIDAAAVKGITRLPWSQIRSGWPILKSPANRHRAVLLTPEEFRYAFGNTLSEEDSRAAYDRYAIPGPGRVLFEGALANFTPHAATKVDFHNDDRAPLLLLAGGADHTVPAVVDASAAKHYKHSKAVTDYKEFPGRSHFTIGEPGWEEVADYALDWAEAHMSVPAAAGA